MHVSSATFSYPETAGHVRADLASRLLMTQVPENTFVLSTCLRIEVLIHGDEDGLAKVLWGMFGDGFSTETASIRSGVEAVEHTFRVASGLESPILGEREILTQFRQAFASAKRERNLDGLLIKLLDTAVSTGRQARQLLPESPHDSMAAVAAQVVGGIDRVAVLGSGIMSKAVARALLGLPAPPDVTVVARSPEKVDVEGVTTWTFDRAPEAIATFPAVVSATSAKARLIEDHALAETLASRRDHLTLVDMAMPPDFSPPPEAPVTYIDIDDLARRADRRSRRRDADAMVAAAAADVLRQLSDHRSIGRVVGGIMASADEIVAEVVDRFSGRLGNVADREILQQAAHTVARTLLAAPVSHIRSPDRTDEAVEAIAKAFGLEGSHDGA